LKLQKRQNVFSLDKNSLISKVSFYRVPFLVFQGCLSTRKQDFKEKGNLNLYNTISIFFQSS